MTPPAKPRRTIGPLSVATQRSMRFMVALGLLIYEAVVREGPTRWEFLVVYCGMMGLSIANRADDLRRMAIDQSGESAE